MALVTALALHDVEYNGVGGRAYAKSGAVISVSEDECLALEAMGAVRRDKAAAPSPAAESAPKPAATRKRRKWRG